MIIGQFHHNLDGTTEFTIFFFENVPLDVIMKKDGSTDFRIETSKKFMENLQIFRTRMLFCKYSHTCSVFYTNFFKFINFNKIILIYCCIFLLPKTIKA